MSVILRPSLEIQKKFGLQRNGPVHSFFTNECAKEMDPFVPFDEGNLAGTVIQNGMPTENVTTDTITYTQGYAKVVYYGIRSGKPIRIHQDKHPKATTYWDKHMWSAKGQDITRRVQKLIERGGH